MARARLLLAAEQQRRDLEKIERKGVRAARVITSKIQRAILAAYQHSQTTPKQLQRMIQTGMFELLRDSMVAIHLIGMRRQVESLPDVSLSLGIFDSTITAIARRLKVDVSILRSRYGIQSLRVLQSVSAKTETDLQRLVADLTLQGTNPREGIKLLRNEFENIGIAPKNDFQIETIFRTQTQFAYNAGKYIADQAPEIQEILWGYEYLTVGDDRVRPEHEKLDGVKLPKDDPFWTKFWPPNGYNCRCVAVPIYEEQEIKQPPDDVQPDEGFGFNVGVVFGTGVQFDLAGI